MARIVAKFGGTSVADSKSINNVISILKDNDEPLFIIVSAFGGITNLLQKCIVSKGKSVDEIINEIEQRHLEVIDNLSNIDKQSSLKSFLKQNITFNINCEYCKQKLQWKSSNYYGFGEFFGKVGR